MKVSIISWYFAFIKKEKKTPKVKKEARLKANKKTYWIGTSEIL